MEFPSTLFFRNGYLHEDKEKKKLPIKIRSMDKMIDDMKSAVKHSLNVLDENSLETVSYSNGLEHG